jgi:preprotein translocase subunit SecY
MLTAFIRAFRTPDLRKKLLFTVFILAVFRLGAALPTPGVDEGVISKCLGGSAAQKNNVLQLVNLFSGGALQKLTVFALGIMPYITASIILQLLAVVIPRLETLRQEGQTGQAKITQYTRYLTIGLAILQATGIIALERQPDPELHGHHPASVGLHHHHDGDHHDGRHRGHHVARRARHRPRHR